MPRYKRAYEGRTYFFTVVTYKRRAFLCDEIPRAILKDSIKEVRAGHPFQIDAWVLLPDHMHCIWTLPEGDSDYSTRWGLIKASFSKRMKRAAGSARPTEDSGYWQKRFWEHMIRDQKDYNAHMDYVHYNPVKHGLASSPADWEFSSFHRLVQDGVYERGWGSAVEMNFVRVGKE